MLQTHQPEIPQQNDPPPTKSDSAADRRVTLKREFALSPEADDALDVLVRAFRRGTATRINNSQVMRPVLVVVAEVARSLEQILTAEQPWRMPSNGAGYEDERAVFEERLMCALRDALAHLFKPDSN